SSPAFYFNVDGIVYYSLLFPRGIESTLQVFPVFLPGLDCPVVFMSPFFIQSLQGVFCGLPVGSSIHLLEVGAEGFSVFPDHVFAAVSDLVDDAQLGDCLREYAFYGI